VWSQFPNEALGVTLKSVFGFKGTSNIKIKFKIFELELGLIQNENLLPYDWMSFDFVLPEDGG
jgi:hypothetical protein